MNIAIVSDSACDLPSDLAKHLNVTITPIYINIGDKSYLDGVDISREEFYTKLATYPVHPTTSAPGPGVFASIYNRLIKAGAEKIISLHLSSALSNTCNSAHLAAEALEEKIVTVFDSGQLSLGLGLLVIQTARMVQEGQSLQNILAILNEKRKRAHTVAALNTLEFLKRSGRLNFIGAQIGSFLQIKPVIKMFDGKAGIEMIRSRTRAIQRVIQLLKNLEELESFAFVHTFAGQDMVDFRQQCLQFLPPDLERFEEVVTPVIGAHIGPGAIGFSCISRN